MSSYFKRRGSVALVVAVPLILVGGPRVPIAAPAAGGGLSAKPPATFSLSAMEHMPSGRLVYAPLPKSPQSVAGHARRSGAAAIRAGR
jgi:hypothetical protein